MGGRKKVSAAIDLRTLVSHIIRGSVRKIFGRISNGQEVNGGRGSPKARKIKHEGLLTLY